MKTYKLEDMTRGWFIGDFEPSVLRTSSFEVGLLSHEKGTKWSPHYHKQAVEYNVLVSGLMKIQDIVIHPGDIFVLGKYEVADPEFLEDCRVLCVKTPSVKDDKYEVGD